MLTGNVLNIFSIHHFLISYHRSPPINIEDIGSVHFRLRRGSDAVAFDLIRADVRIEASTIFVYLTEANANWPFVIENGSHYPVHFFQQVSHTGVLVLSS